MRKGEDDQSGMHGFPPDCVSILRGMSTGIVAVDSEWRYTFANDKALEILGKKREELLGKTIWELYPEMIGTEFEQSFRRAADKGVPVTFEAFVPSLNIWFDVYSYALEGGAAIQFTNVNERKKAAEALRGSEQRFRSLYENSLDGVLLVHPDGTVFAANPQAQRLFGMTEEEIKRVGRTGIVVMDERYEAIVEARKRAGHTRGELSLRRSDGSVFPGEVSLGAFRDADGSLKLSMTIRDISDRKKAEQVLRESEKSFVSVFEASPAVIVISRRKDGHYLAVNKAFEIASGYSRSEVIGKTSAELRLFPQSESRDRLLHEVALKGAVYSRELVFRGKEGRTVTGLTSIIPFMFREQECLLFVGVDITERKKAETALAESKAILDAFIAYAPGIAVIMDDQLRHLKVNQAAAEIIGRSPQEIEGKRFEELMPSELVPGFMVDYRNIIQTGKAVLNKEFSVHSTRKPGSIRILANRFPIPLPGGKRGIGVFGLDITGRKEAEDALRRNEYELRTLIENSPDLIFRLNRRMEYVFVNPAYERVTGISREKFIGRTNQQLGMAPQLVEFWRSAVLSVLENGREHSVEFEMMSLFGKRYFSVRLIPEFEKSGQVETVLAIARDISEQKRAEERVRYISFHDEVTGLFNRAFFEEELRRVDTERDLPVSIVIGDVNNLKLTNDVFGHDEGDRLLKAIADGIRGACRQSDIVARWGGDEFAIILPNTEFVVADEVCSRMIQLTGERRGTIIQPSIALGIAAKEHRDQNIYQVVRQAEQLMYDFKMAHAAMNEKMVIASLLEYTREHTPNYSAHVERTGELARRFGDELGFTEDQVSDLRMLVELHDIGNAVIPREILTKPQRLNDEEWQRVKKHPEAGFKIARTFGDTARIADDILSHAEYWDGSGYPRGLAGRNIPLLSRLFRIIDAFDVMTHPRPYARTLPTGEAVEELRRNAGRQFDPELTDAFIRMVTGTETAAVKS